MIWIVSISCLKMPLIAEGWKQTRSCTHYKLQVSKSGRGIEVPSAWDLRYEIQEKSEVSNLYIISLHPLFVIIEVGETYPSYSV
jgi:hypothetical protein